MGGALGTGSGAGSLLRTQKGKSFTMLLVYPRTRVTLSMYLRQARSAAILQACRGCLLPAAGWRGWQTQAC